MPETVALTEAEQQQVTALEAAFKEEGLEMPKFGADGQVEQPTQQPASDAITEGETPDSLPKPSTPAAAEPKEKPTEPQKKNETQEQGSKFAKDKARRDDSWKALNADKELTRKEKEQVAADRAALQREREQWEQQRAKSSAKYKPEDYEQYSLQAADRAKSYELQAKGLEKEAEELEGDGKYSEAQQQKARASELREAAIVQKHQAKEAKKQADYLRANPEPTAKQFQEKTEAQKRDWTMRAAEKWPDLAKEGSEFQKTVIGHLQALAKDAPELAEYPGIIYHVARLTAAEAENKSFAARVPALEKELGEAKARVKELELLTSPGGGNSAATRVTTEEPKFHELSLEQQEAILQASWNSRP